MLSDGQRAASVPWGRRRWPRLEGPLEGQQARTERDDAAHEVGRKAQRERDLRIDDHLAAGEEKQSGLLSLALQAAPGEEMRSQRCSKRRGDDRTGWASAPGVGHRNSVGPLPGQLPSLLWLHRQDPAQRGGSSASADRQRLPGAGPRCGERRAGVHFLAVQCLFLTRLGPSAPCCARARRRRT